MVQITFPNKHSSRKLLSLLTGVVAILGASGMFLTVFYSRSVNASDDCNEEKMFCYRDCFKSREDSTTCKDGCNRMATKCETGITEAPATREYSPVSGNGSEEKEWIDNGYGDPVITNLNMRKNDGRTYTHEFDVDVVLLRNSGWSEAEVRELMSKATEVYMECGIQLANVKIVTATAPQSTWIDSYMESEKGLVRSLPSAVKRPTVFFVRSNREGNWAYSYNKEVCGTSPRCDTAWVTKDIFSPVRINQFKGDNWKYVVGHEIAHLVGNCSHNNDSVDNIMNDNPQRVSKYPQYQLCNSIKQHASVRRINNYSSAR